MTSVCSVGLDMVAIPGDTPRETIAGLIADEMAIGVSNNKTTATRLIPVPGMAAGEHVSFGGLFGQGVVLPVRGIDGSNQFVRFGGRIPAPIQSLRNEPPVCPRPSGVARVHLTRAWRWRPKRPPSPSTSAS